MKALAFMVALATAQSFVWRPNPGPQTRFVSCGADEVLYGGAAGGGKSDGLLAGVTRWINEPQFRALILRRTFPELKKSLYDRAGELYKGIDPGATFNETDKEWEFSTGAKLYFGHAQYEHDVEQYQGAAFQFIGFDELTHFTEKQYLYLFTRARSAHGLPVRVRATANPGGPGHDWVQRRWAPWLDRRPEYTGYRAASGEVLYFLPGRTPDEPERMLEGGKAEARDLLAAWEQLSAEDQANTPRPRSRTFIGAKLSDNPALMRNDPGYADRIRVQDALTRRQLLDGDWMARAYPGLLFRRAMFKMLDAQPTDTTTRVRFWDRAATEPNPVNPDPDWTVGVRMSKLRDSGWCVEDVVRVRCSPGMVEQTIKNTAVADGKQCEIHLSEDPGSAGKFEAAYYVNALAGYVVKTLRETGDKLTRAKPFSAQCEAGNVSMVRGPWNEPYWQILEAFPSTGVHDDDVDASAGAFAALTDGIDEYLQAMRNLRDNREKR